MQTFVIWRRNGWKSAEELEEAAARSRRIGDEEIADQVRWIRSYVIDEGDSLGTVCIYQATNPEALRDHAQRVGMPADEILPVADTVVIRPDPEPAAALGPSEPNAAAVLAVGRRGWEGLAGERRSAAPAVDGRSEL
jgi:Nickel responsive protein SCO4226-like